MALHLPTGNRACGVYRRFVTFITNIYIYVRMYSYSQEHWRRFCSRCLCFRFEAESWSFQARSSSRANNEQLIEYLLGISRPNSICRLICSLAANLYACVSFEITFVRSNIREKERGRESLIGCCTCCIYQRFPGNFWSFLDWKMS